MPRKPTLQTTIPGFGFIYRPTYRDKTTGKLKNSAVWWMEYKASDRPVRKSTRQRDQTQAYSELLKIAGKRASGEIIDSAPERVRISQLLDLVLEDYDRRGLRTLYDTKLRIEKKLRPHFGELRAMDLRRRDIQRFIDGLKHPEGDAEALARATVNRYVSILHRAFQLGAEQDPPLVLRIPKFDYEDEADNVREGILERTEYELLRNELAPHARLALVLAHHTGMRRGELLKIRWEQVDFAAGVIWLERKQTKNKNPRVAPIYGEMRANLDMAKAEQDTNFPACPFVIAFAGGQVKSIRKAWDAAIRRLKLRKVLLHDLRRTALTNMEEAGIPRHVAMKISGHRTESVYRRYLIGSKKQVVEAGQILERWMEKTAPQPTKELKVC